MKTIKVAAAVICKEGRIFATQRGYGEWKDSWEFPGGKLESGEAAEEAVIREIQEELDTEIKVEQELMTVEYEYPTFHLSMKCYLCSIVSGALELKEHEAARWLFPEELDAVAWLPADLEVVKELKTKRSVTLIRTL